MLTLRSYTHPEKELLGFRIKNENLEALNRDKYICPNAGKT